jgi:hypothetical protein
MAKVSPVLPLDRSHPFIKAVFDVIEKKGTIGTVVDLLLAAERKHEVYVLGDPFASAVDGMYSLRIDGAAPSTNDVLSRIKAGQDLKPHIQRSSLSNEEWYAQVLFPFMDDIPLILTGGNLSNDYCVISRGPFLASFTWRWWGGIVADWANRSLRASVPPYTWEYLDFYMDHGTPLFPKYSDWAKVLRHALNDSTDKVYLSLP